MIRLIALTTVVLSMASCRSGTSPEASDVEASGASASAFTTVLSCSDDPVKLTNQFSTDGKGGGTLNVSGQNIPMKCEKSFAPAPAGGMGDMQLGSCTQKTGSGYRVNISMSSGMTVSYQAVARNTGSPIFLFCTLGSGKVDAPCPKPGTSINCFPSSTDSDCVPVRRAWIQKHCPRVSFTD